MSEFFKDITPEQEAELKKRHEAVVAEAKREEERQRKEQEKRMAIYRMTQPETYADIIIKEITDNPESFKPDVMRQILVRGIQSAMDVWSHGGHLLYIAKDKKIRCLHCGVEFKEDNIPQTKLCSLRQRRKKK